MPCALVLSAGGMFGAYQAGAWNVLSQRFQPDLVVGTSVGALNGWAIAGGCSPAALVAMWRDPATAGVMRLRFPLLPWNGWIDPAGLLRQVEDWYTRFQPRVPYSATVVQVPQLRLVRVPHERITPLHLMASCAVPFGYPPVRIDGRLYVDGGLPDVLPGCDPRDRGECAAPNAHAFAARRGSRGPLLRPEARRRARSRHRAGLSPHTPWNHSGCPQLERDERRAMDSAG